MKKCLAALVAAMVVVFSGPTIASPHSMISFSYLESERKPSSAKLRTKRSTQTAQHRSRRATTNRATRPTAATVTAAVSVGIPARRFNAGARPGRWCGWYMRTLYGGGPEYNLARNWAKRGVAAGGPRVGAVVVWKSHVGVITGRNSNGQWLVHSGNTAGGKIATKPRSVSGAIAFRML